MRYQTAPRPEGFSAAPRSRYVGSSYAEAGDRDRTGDGSLEGSCVTNYTTPALRSIIGSVARRLLAGGRRGFAKLGARGTVLGARSPAASRLLRHAAASTAKIRARPRPARL